MPELPEVETIARGLRPHILGRTITDLEVRQPQLRWPVPVAELRQYLIGNQFTTLERRGKVLLLTTATATGVLLIHLGMSGTVQLRSERVPWQRHDHWQMVFDHDPVLLLRYHDPRRFGALLWCRIASLAQHPLLARLGPEPLDAAFNAEWLLQQITGRRRLIKQWLMDHTCVAGIGNIYASEALFHAGIHPMQPVGSLNLAACQRLVTAIQATLRRAIDQGGTTLRDFADSQGRSGYFQQQLAVYGRQGQPCHHCQTPVERLKMGQRSTFFCPSCQASLT
ncbi:MAG: bifunctional DNA-formamidopyrimidine glycosylase/DNA-(apurinic or apyrimidinic site) lyase [Magnetococcales bacterium]|nr:bifunctional DNA-formamidopyrimidine glycosylase/DNA-(apurinic or apyrimidinic site) lyase [Magnetococcales bacterium]